MAPRTVALPDGAQLELHPSPDYLSDEVARTGDYFEAGILSAVLARLEPTGTLVDAGAMVGNHAVYLARHLPAAAVHAWEPVPANRALLRRNAVPYPNLAVHAAALSDRSGHVRLALEAGNLGHARVSPHGRVRARCYRLDDYSLARVRLLKIDVEGHELQVLAGAQGTLARWRPLVLIEDWEQAYGTWLAAHGYHLEQAWPDQQTYLYAPAPAL